MPKGGNMAQAKKSGGKALTFHLFAVNLLEKLVEVFKGILTSSFFAFCVKWVTRIGHLAIIVAAGLGFLCALIFAIRADSFIGFLYGIVWVLLIFVAQYTANKFLDAGETLIQNNPTQLSSKAFLDCVGFLSMIGGVVALIIHIIRLIQGETFRDFLIGLGIFIFLEFLALLAFNHDEITIKVVKGNSAGQEALGIVTFFIKSYMKLIPIFFGVLIVVGTILLFIGLIGLFGDNPSMENIFEAAAITLIAALLPFIAYIAFALFYLCIDVIKAILSIPGKLDTLGKK